ncbi:MAG: glycine cleavage system protein GcvH [Planctomycetota bacterium]|nr:MAG: glycine cleavage system protein GcvH [Planctomycetota bacterium]
MNPEQLRYTKTHEWVRLDEEGGEPIAVVGLSAFATAELSDIVFIELPEPGTTLKAGEPFGQIESVKAVSDMYAPIGGEVVAVNQEAVDDVGVIQESPEDKGWLIKLRPSDPGEIESLLDPAAYKKQCEEESDH